MPELPEVETVVVSLRKKIINKKVVKVIVNYPKMIKTDLIVFKTKLINQVFNEVYRRGKYIIFVLDDYLLIAHMRMEGRFYFGNDLLLRHNHVTFILNEGNLYYQDFRKFGTMSLYDKNTDVETLLNLGIEAISENLDYKYLKNIVGYQRKSIKEVLLNQKIVAGIGNIYADEICFRSNIHPASMCNALSNTDFKVLTKNIKEVLDDAILAGGNSIKDYTGSIIDGRFDFKEINHFRNKEYCIKCGNKINKVKLKGRGTYYCGKCQKLKVK